MLYTDGGDGYVKYGTVDFCPSAKLTDPIGETDLTFDIDSLESFTDVNANTWFQLNDELLEFVSYSAPTLTVRRGLLDTVPMAHSAGDVLFFWDEFSEGDRISYVAGDRVFTKLSPVTGAGELPNSSSSNQDTALVSRANAPYPPANVMLNEFSFPTSLSGALTISWNTRNRLQQTAATRIDWFDAQDIAAEEGTTYKISVHGGVDSSGSVLFSQDEITEQAFQFSALPIDGDLTIKVSSFRDGIESFQSFEHTFDYILPTSAPNFQDATSVQTSDSVASIDLTYPSPLTSGDLLVAAVMHRTAGVTPPAGWSFHVSSSAIGSSQLVSFFVKTAAGDETGDETFTGASTARMSGFMYRFTNAANLGALEESSAAGTSSTITPSWISRTLYVHHSNFSSSSETYTQTGAETDIGLLTGDNLRMISAFDPYGSSSLAIHNTGGGDTASIAIQILQENVIAPIEPTGPFVPSPFWFNNKWWSFTSEPFEFTGPVGGLLGIRDIHTYDGAADGSTWTLANQTVSLAIASSNSLACMVMTRLPPYRAAPLPSIMYMILLVQLMTGCSTG